MNFETTWTLPQYHENQLHVPKPPAIDTFQAILSRVCGARLWKARQELANCASLLAIGVCDNSTWSAGQLSGK